MFPRAEAALQSRDRQGAVTLRWLAITLIVLSSSLNYLDRQLLAAAAPSVQSEFHLNNAQYGQIVSAFSLVYGIMAPFAGVFIDRVGLNAGVSSAVALWSLASVSTGLVRTFPALLTTRAVLGMAESAGIPNSGKANATYLKSSELALGTGLNQIGISLGAIAAPLIMAALAPLYGWRSGFIVSGVLGLLWIPLWRSMARRGPAGPVTGASAPAASSARAGLTATLPACTEASTPPAAPPTIKNILRDRRFWGLVVTTLFIMTLYTLWSNWMTLYFVHERHMTQDEANRQFAWIPPVFAGLGGLSGGAIMYRWINRGMNVIRARLRLCTTAAAILLLTAAIPLAPTSGIAAAAISLSFFFSVALSGAVYALPIDLFGPARAGFSVAALTCAYGWMQTLLSPLIGGTVDRFGFSAVCVSLSFTPLLGVAILRFSLR
ncbi:MAG TPA: MFS transporter [Bryobacteraceae bacterium]|jgi:ACS family hexuronate transporter-like MFS transporter